MIVLLGDNDCEIQIAKKTQNTDQNPGAVSQAGNSDSVASVFFRQLSGRLSSQKHRRAPVQSFGWPGESSGDCDCPLQLEKKTQNTVQSQ